jgi:acetyl-CoA carboxylase biotin carboxyl carrier protein
MKLMENKKVFELMDKFEKSSIDTLILKDGEFALTLKKNKDVPINAAYIAPQNITHNFTTENVKNEEKTINSSEKVIKSPIVGTFYGSSSPEKPPFVTVGSKVALGDTVCIVEAMKMFNEVSTEFDGIVKEILVQNGENIEYGQPLIVLE